MNISTIKYNYNNIAPKNINSSKGCADDYKLKGNISKNSTPSFKGGKDRLYRSVVVSGNQTQAKIFTENVDFQAIDQIQEFCNHPAFKDAPIRIMPDTHAGVNSVVGFSAPIVNGMVIPNIIGGDIGCGVLCVKFDTNGQEIDFKKLDDVIKSSASSLKKDVKLPQNYASFYKTVSDICKHKYKKSPEKILTSLGTLGGGNHFIEIDKDDRGQHYLIIHSGSRNFGKEVGNYHQEIAKKQNPYRNAELSYLSGAEAKDYLEDMQIAVLFSQYSRQIMADEILKKMGWTKKESFESVHNYISRDEIIRKGAISAQKEQKLIIPLNMRDGSLLGRGKGNADWNYTAPHGSGRQYKRSQAAEHISFEDYQKSMEGIYSSCITPCHIDESPQAYKDSGGLMDDIVDTVDVEDIISPIYNYKD